MSVREATRCALTGREVSAELLRAAFLEILDGDAGPASIAGLLVALRAKGESVGEMVAAASALRARARPAPEVDPRCVDTCGTGGDGRNTFNISTTAAFVVAGAGVPVAKHGNRAVSSRTGSFDVLEALGVRIDLPVEDCARVLAEVGIAPFFAQTAHPAMRQLAPVRRELGIRTLMNCLGPLLNPVGVRYQLVGVFEPSLVEPLARALVALGASRALVVHGSDGLDEITTNGVTSAVLARQGGIEHFEIDPEPLGIAPAQLADLAGGDASHNAKLLLQVLEGEIGPRRDIVALNAAGALWTAGAVHDLAEGLARAHSSIDSGAARERLDALVRATRRVSG